MVSTRRVVWAGELESETLISNWKDPPFPGIPEMAPDIGLRVNPGGRLPNVMSQVRDPIPPVADTVAEQDNPNRADGRVAVLMLNTSPMRIVYCAVAVLMLNRSPARIVYCAVAVCLGTEES